MSLLLWPRDDIGSEIQGVKNTYSSWDQCMTKDYCKWPAIIGIVVASLVVLSLVWCIARCLCCGAECCCGCLACCNACCPSPRRGRSQGYQQPPPQPLYSPYPTYNQYQPPPQPPVYSAGALGYRGPQTASFDVSSSQKQRANINADALPSMPTWENAQTHRVEEPGDVAEEVEMEKLVPRSQPRSPSPRLPPLISPNHHSSQSRYDDPRARSPYGPSSTYPHPQQGRDFGDMHATSPYDDYNEYPPPMQQQQSYGMHSAFGAPSQSPTYPPTYHSSSVPMPALASIPAQYPNHQQRYQQGYEPSIAPSYHTAPPNRMMSPPLTSNSPPPLQQGRPPSGLQIGRKPIQGSWREV